MTLLSNRHQAAWLDAHPAFASADVVSVYRPTTVTELRLALDEIAADGCVPAPVGAGHHAPPSVDAPLALLLTEELPIELDLDPRSMTVRVSAGWRWGALDDALQAQGFSVRHLVDTFADGTVGGTLGRRSWVPATWESATARAEVSGVSGLTHRGHLYRGVDAPRTASGPDLRSVFLSGEGRLGTLTYVTLTVTRAGEARWFEAPAALAHPLLPQLRSLTAGDARHVTIRWGAPGTIAIALTGATALTAQQASTLEGWGFVEAAWPDQTTPAPHYVVTLPWSAAAAQLSGTSQVVGATATHVAIARPADEAALAWAMDLSRAPLTRAVGLGVPMAADRGRLTAPLRDALLAEERP